MKKAQTVQKSQAVRMGVPTVQQRLAAIDRVISMVAAGLGADEDELSKHEPDVQAVTLSADDVRAMVGLLSRAKDHYWFIVSTMPAEVLSALAPTEDQVKSFEPIETVSRRQAVQR